MWLSMSSKIHDFVIAIGIDNITIGAEFEVCNAGLFRIDITMCTKKLFIDSQEQSAPIYESKGIWELVGPLRHRTYSMEKNAEEARDEAKSPKFIKFFGMHVIYIKRACSPWWHYELYN